MLRHCFNDYVLFPGIYQFLDRSGLLAAKFTRTNDLYHIGDRGIAQLVSIIRQSVYRRECENRAVSIKKNFIKQNFINLYYNQNICI